MPSFKVRLKKRGETKFETITVGENGSVDLPAIGLRDAAETMRHISRAVETMKKENLVEMRIVEV